MPSPVRPMLVAAEGPDGAGKLDALERLAAWLERRDRRVSIVPWEPSRLVRRAAGASRTRRALTPRVAALLGAVDAAGHAELEIRPRLAGDRVVLAHRYAWTAVARDVARGVDPDWSGSLYAALPRPDLVLLFRPGTADVVERALAHRSSDVRIEAVAAAFGGFVARLLGAYDDLARGSGRDGALPWPVPVVVVDPRLTGVVLERQLRDVLRPLLDGSERSPGPVVLGPGRAGVAA